MEIELLETNCHVLDPTPVANCTVRPKHLTVRMQFNLTQLSYSDSVTHDN